MQAGLPVREKAKDLGFGDIFLSYRLDTRRDKEAAKRLLANGADPASARKADRRFVRIQSFVDYLDGIGIERAILGTVRDQGLWHRIEVVS
jgi:hypothetical protein